MQGLEKRGASVDYNDPFVPVIKAGRSHHAVAGRESKPITADYDVIVLSTNHHQYRDVDFAALGVPVVDCRNAITKRPVSYYPA